MVQRFLATLLILAGLGSIGYGVASATVLRESDTVVATATPSGDGTMVVTEPGVLGLVDDQVTVRATVPEGQKVTLALGSDVDVLGWVGKDPYDSVTGLSSWETLTVVPGAGLAADDGAAAEEGAPDEPVAKPSTGPEPAGSDMWLSEVSGETTVSMRWTEEPGRVVLLAAGVGENAEAPTLELTWPRSVATPFLWPGVLGGGLLLILGVFIAIGASRSRRRGGGKTRPSSSDARQPASEPSRRSAILVTGGGQSSPARPGGQSPPAPSDPPDGRTAAFPATPTGRTTGQGKPEGVMPDPDPLRAHGAAAPFGAAAPITPASAPEPGPTPEQPAVARPASFRGMRRGRRSPAQEVAPTDMPDGPKPFGGAVPDPAAAHPAAHLAGSAAAQTAPAAADKPMTRRELRMREQAQRRAATGTMPAVPAPDPAPEPEPEPDETPSSRAAAWRQTWGVTGGDGGNR